MLLFPKIKAKNKLSTELFEINPKQQGFLCTIHQFSSQCVNVLAVSRPKNITSTPQRINSSNFNHTLPTC